VIKSPCIGFLSPLTLVTYGLVILERRTKETAIQERLEQHRLGLVDQVEEEAKF